MSHTSRMSSLGASTELRVMARTIFGNDWCTALAGSIGREYWAVGTVGSTLPWRGRGHRFDPGTVHHFDNRRVARSQWIREFLQRRLYASAEQLSIPVDRGVSGDLRFGVLIAV